MIIPRTAPDELAQQIRDSIPAGQEQEMFDTVSRSPHPDAAGALSLLGQHHPDKQASQRCGDEYPGG